MAEAPRKSTHNFIDSGSQFFISVNDSSGLDRT